MSDTAQKSSAAADLTQIFEPIRQDLEAVEDEFVRHIQSKVALIPEMALGYDARTSLNTFRSAGAILGTLAAIGIRPLADAFGGGSQGFLAAGAIYGAAANGMTLHAMPGVTSKRSKGQWSVVEFIVDSSSTVVMRGDVE